MANHTKTVTLTDVQQQILSNDLYNDTDNAGLDYWIQNAVDGKINNCWKRMQREQLVDIYVSFDMFFQLLNGFDKINQSITNKTKSKAFFLV